MELSKCKLCEKPFVFKGNGVYESTCQHAHSNICAVCGEAKVHHVGTVKACFGGMGTCFTAVTDDNEQKYAEALAMAHGC